MNSGDINRIDVQVEEFKEIFINDIFDVYLYQDSICKLSIEGGSNLLPEISYKVTDGKLTVSNKNTAQWSRDYEKIKLHISVNKLLYLYLKESSKIHSVDTIITPQLEVYSITDYADIYLMVKCDNFYFVNEGTSGAYIELKGSSQNFNSWIRASAILKADEFFSENVIIETESIGDCYVYATKKLTVKINNSGNIYYTGNPETIILLNDRAKQQLIEIK
ncbi:MAG: hypothetical protein A2W99_12290 [Bacteroidetes bacterium GWF2_33_16]|nr:MAG: hypothetical protein A2X00_01985 [Bacteroidetes bacterium GWE2_32_14]OFY06474.1 MAG: hypothetical protein A2W99_12290 [Bacteroidetes bacterium GWF2_33_16]